MSQASKVLRKSKDRYFWYCPGCKEIHGVPVRTEPRPCWTFNGDVDKPTFRPSVRHFIPADKDDGTPEETTCHYFITDGNIVFQNDCPHELKGQTVPMVELGPEYSDSNYGWPA